MCATCSLRIASKLVPLIGFMSAITFYSLEEYLFDDIFYLCNFIFSRKDLYHYPSFVTYIKMTNTHEYYPIDWCDLFIWIHSLVGKCIYVYPINLPSVRQQFLAFEMDGVSSVADPVTHFSHTQKVSQACIVTLDTLTYRSGYSVKS